MALIFKPGLLRNASVSGSSPCIESLGGGTVFWLPCPISSFPSIHEFKSKLEEPVTSVGGKKKHNRRYQTSDLSITGNIARSTYWDRDAHDIDPTVAFATDVEMIDTYWDLVEFLKMPLDTDEMELIGWYDEETGEKRSVQGIFPISLSTDAGDPHRNMLPYTIQVSRLDPALYT